MNGAVVVRPALAEDLPAILSVEAKCHSVTWSPDGFAKELSDPNVCAQVAVSEGGAVIGFVVAHIVLDECTILALAVLPLCQRSGVGGTLVKELIELAIRRGCAAIFLEVRSKNAGALAFYRSFGFSFCGSRKAYYRDDLDDAVLMRRQLRLSA